MKLFEILKLHGLKSNDIKLRFAGDQIIVNGSPVNKDFIIGNVREVWDQGLFLEKLKEFGHTLQLEFFGIKNLISSNIKNELTDFLSNFKMVQISKSDIIFIKTINESEDVFNIEWNLEGEKKFNTQINLSQSQLTDNDIIEKLEKDRDKVKKQLSNKGFINNAPQFKIDASKKRLERIEVRLKSLKVSN